MVAFLLMSEDWRQDFNLDVSKALAKAGVGDCGQYEWRPEEGGGFVVRGTRDGKKWSLYRIDTEGEVVPVEGAPPAAAVDRELLAEVSRARPALHRR